MFLGPVITTHGPLAEVPTAMAGIFEVPPGHRGRSTLQLCQEYVPVDIYSNLANSGNEIHSNVTSGSIKYKPSKYRNRIQLPQAAGRSFSSYKPEHLK